MRRFLRLLAKILMMLFLALLLGLVVLHVPVIQRSVSHTMAKYLARKTGGAVELGALYWSLAGNVEIRDLVVCDPQGDCFFRVERLAVDANVWRLFQGDLVLESVAIETLKGHLHKEGDLLNMGFIIDAFSSGTQREKPKNPAAFGISVGDLALHNVEFRFSRDSLLDLDAYVSHLTTREAHLSLNPNTIRVASLQMEGSGCRLLLGEDRGESTTATQSSASIFLPSFQLYSGFDIAVDSLALSDNYFSLDIGERHEARFFDPQHLRADHIALEMSGLQMTPDRLQVEIHKLSSQLAGLNVHNLRALIQADGQQLTVDTLQLETNLSSVAISLAAKYDEWQSVLAEPDQVDAMFEARGFVDRAFLEWLFHDELADQLPDSDLRLVTELRVDGSRVAVEKLVASTLDARLQFTGRISNLSQTEQLSWERGVIDIVAGAKSMRWARDNIFRRPLPARLDTRLQTTGTPSNVALTGRISTPWGDVLPSVTAQRAGDAWSLNFEARGQEIALEKWLEIEALGRTSFQIKGETALSPSILLQVSGSIHELFVIGQPIHQISFASSYANNRLGTEAIFDGPAFQGEVSSSIVLGDTLSVEAWADLVSLEAGNWLSMEDSVTLSGKLGTRLYLSQSDLIGSLQLDTFSILRQGRRYQMDSLRLAMATAERYTNFDLRSDDIEASFGSNFGSGELSRIQEVFGSFGKEDSAALIARRDSFQLELLLKEAEPLVWLGVPIGDFSPLRISTSHGDPARGVTLNGQIDHLQLGHLRLDSIRFAGHNAYTSLHSDFEIGGISYDSLDLGFIAASVHGPQEHMVAQLLWRADTLSVIKGKVDLRYLKEDLSATLDSLIVFDEPFAIKEQRPFVWRDNSLLKAGLSLQGPSMDLDLSADADTLWLSIAQAPLERFNELKLVHDTLKFGGLVNASALYLPATGVLDAKGRVDSLTFFGSPPLELTVQLAGDERGMPFQGQLASSRNQLEVRGTFRPDETQALDAAITINLADLREWSAILPTSVEDLSGSIMGEQIISGTMAQPFVNGALRFQNVKFTTRAPRFSFLVRDDQVTLAGREVKFNDFTIYDERGVPMTFDGYVRSEDLSAPNYDLTLHSDGFALVDNPRDADRLRGLLVVAPDLRIMNTGNNTQVQGSLAIKDTTDFTYVLPGEDLASVSNTDVVEFVRTSDVSEVSVDYYDSLLATIPSLTLNARMMVEKKARLRIVIDPESGDFLELLGAADLDIGFDRTGNATLSGVYNVERGQYELSFYNIVRRKFDISKGSTISWNGNPRTGSLNIRAVHVIRSSSLGLLGDEISENEKDIYRRALPYEISINIGGTVEEPVVGFGLDLPAAEKRNYPALANKLNRLNQPDFENALNKQVFALLVLGGFIPESTGSIDETVIASTAVMNSVNSILSNQLNQLTDELIKGFEVDVGLQSYSDFTGSNQGTRTAMDFVVSKRIMNDRLSLEAGGSFNIDMDQSGANAGERNFRSNIAIVYDLNESGTRQLKFFTNESFDIIYNEIENTGLSLIFIREFDKAKKDE